jgi:hypothetical protein
MKCSSIQSHYKIVYTTKNRVMSLEQNIQTNFWSHYWCKHSIVSIQDCAYDTNHKRYLHIVTIIDNDACSFCKSDSESIMYLCLCVMILYKYVSSCGNGWWPVDFLTLNLFQFWHYTRYDGYATSCKLCNTDKHNLLFLCVRQWAGRQTLPRLDPTWRMLCIYSQW